MSEIGEVNDGNEAENLMNWIYRKLETLPDPLTYECCIYKVPNIIRQLKKEAYSPSVISIGPFHNGEKGLESMENLKLRYLQRFLERVGDRLLGEFVRYLKESEGRIRHSYAETVEPKVSDDFVKMILIDSCFIVEYFIRDRSQDWSDEDHVLLKPWLRGTILLDLSLLENQIPFFVLENLYNMALKSPLLYNREALPPSFFELSKFFFRLSEMRGVDMAEMEQVKHFTDMIRVSYLPPPTDEQLDRSRTQQKVVEHFPSASQLYDAGFKLSAKPDKGLLVQFKKKDKGLLVHLGFENGVLEMTRFRIYDDTEIFVRNVMAFEECHCKPGVCYVTQFIILLDFLINTSADVDVLVRQGIIVNRLGDSTAVADMVNNLCKNIVDTRVNSHYLQVSEDVCRVYKSGRCQKWMAILKREYFGTPWKVAGFVAASSIILLTLIQTICSCGFPK